MHQQQLKAAELRMQRESLAGRLFEDYGVRLEELTATEPLHATTPEAEGEASQEPAPIDPEACRAEIDQLRDKIARLGNVNLQAIEELDQLEQRTGNLELQLDDLTTAKRHLEEVISRINEESRRLFLDTFETVREHFQELFRKLFGGGKADILLEDETDVLETGIEIIARPPGKEPRSISLLSGGEKTMTAVALVMALFRSRPSPFCILDEVDAALDEANIGRFVASLKEFLKDTQFILITHSKTTMSAADMLHGVTQRESGVSIRVSVRLQDVTEDGRILESHPPESQPDEAN
jgi:chromosome segregation protein